MPLIRKILFVVVTRFGSTLTVGLAAVLVVFTLYLNSPVEAKLSSDPIEAVQLGWSENHVRLALGTPPTIAVDEYDFRHEDPEKNGHRIVYEYETITPNKHPIKAWVHFVEGRVVEVYVKDKGMSSFADDAVSMLSRSFPHWGTENLRKLLPVQDRPSVRWVL